MIVSGRSSRTMRLSGQVKEDSKKKRRSQEQTFPISKQWRMYAMPAIRLFLCNQPSHQAGGWFACSEQVVMEIILIMSQSILGRSQIQG